MRERPTAKPYNIQRIVLYRSPTTHYIYGSPDDVLQDVIAQTLPPLTAWMDLHLQPEVQRKEVGRP